jgi:hypothetical protein
LGSKFTILTDQGALPWLFNHRAQGKAPREVPKILENWMMNFEEYDYDLVHRAGNKQVLSDALSRLETARTYTYAAAKQVPVAEETADAYATTAEPPGVVLLTTSSSHPSIPSFLETDLQIFSAAELRQAQRADKSLAWCFDFLEKGKVVPRRNPLRDVFTHNKNLLHISDGILMRRAIDKTGEGVLQKVVPASLRPRVLHFFHVSLTSAHLGADRMEATMLRSVWWIDMRTDIRRFTDSCECKNAKSRARPERQHPLGQMETGTGPNSIVCADFCGPFAERDGYVYVLVVSCMTTKYSKAFASKTQTAAEIAYILLHGWVLNYGLMSKLLSDQGSGFCSEVISHLGKLLGFSSIFTTAYHQEADGQSERMVQLFTNSLCASAEFDVDWIDRLDYIGYAYNCSYHPSIKAIPFQLWFGRLPTGLTEIDQSQVPSGPKDKRDQQQVAYDVLVKIIDSCKEAESQLAAKRAATKRFHDAHVPSKRPQYDVGQPVWLFDPAIPKGESKKVYNPWTGPWLIKEVFPDVFNAVLIRHDYRGEKKVHFNRLRPYKAPLAPLERSLAGRKKAYVYDVINSRQGKSGKEFLVRWMSLNNDAPDSWLPESSVPVKLVARYLARN